MSGIAPIIITPADRAHWLELKAKDVSSTEVAALFGCSPYTTEFELWHTKHDGEVIDFDPNERMEWGNALESAIATRYGEKHGLTVEPMKDYYRHGTVPRCGSSFDFKIIDHPEYGVCILEIKNVDRMIFKDQWTDEEPPLHIVFQVQYQLEIADMDAAIIAVLVGGNEMHEYTITRNRKAGEKLIARACEFWASVDANEPPEPDFERDAAYIMTLYSHAAPGTVVDLTANEDAAALAKSYQIMTERAKEATTAKDALKAELIERHIGEHAKALLEDFTISCGSTKETVVPEYVRKPYRLWRVTNKKKKG